MNRKDLVACINELIAESFEFNQKEVPLNLRVLRSMFGYNGKKYFRQNLIRDLNAAGYEVVFKRTGGLVSRSDFIFVCLK